MNNHLLYFVTLLTINNGFFLQMLYVYTILTGRLCSDWTFLFQNDPELTGTFKQVKFRLVKEGFDPSTIRDPLFIVDPGRKTYSPLTQDCYDSIWSGKVKL